jgi:hypothetical protein
MSRYGEHTEHATKLKEFQTSIPANHLNLVTLSPEYFIYNPTETSGSKLVGLK